MTDNIILPHCQKVWHKSEVVCSKDLIHGRHFGVSSHPPFLPVKTDHILLILNPSGQHRAKDIQGSSDSIMHFKSSSQKCTRSPLKTYTDILLYSNPRAWMILISIRIGPSHSTLRNHSLKFRNQIDPDFTLVMCCLNSYYSNSLCQLSLLCLANILRPKYVLYFYY